MTLKDLIITNLRHTIYRLENKKPDIKFERVDDSDDFIYTLDIDVYKIQQKTIDRLIGLAQKYDEYLTHELLKNRVLRFHFNIFEL